MVRKTHRRAHKKRATRRRQAGGGGWGYTGSIMTAAGAPLENRVSYEHCSGDTRVAPAVGTPTLWGGSRRRQRGGGCSACYAPQQLLNQSAGGAGTGGYSLSFDNNSLGKVYSGIEKAPCPQAGGASTEEIVAFPASYGYGPSSAYLSSSAHFLEPISGVSRCASGGRRRTKKHRRAHRRR
jgi:hypothetical protein